MTHEGVVPPRVRPDAARARSEQRACDHRASARAPRARDGYEYQSDFARKYFGQGLEKGREVGREEGLAQAVLDVLDTRGLRIPKIVRERVLSCADITQVSQWLRRAVTVAKARDIFGEPAT